MHSENDAPVFFMFLIPNDLVLINYHFVPIVISYFRHFWYFTQLGWLYKPPYDFCNPNFHFYASFPASLVLGSSPLINHHDWCVMTPCTYTHEMQCLSAYAMHYAISYQFHVSYAMNAIWTIPNMQYIMYHG